MSGKFNDNLNVLGYGNLSKLETMMSSHFLSQLREVSDEVTGEPRTMVELNYYLKDGEFTHLFVLDEHFHQLEGSLKGCSVPVVELLGDHWVPWAVEKKREYLSDNEIKHVIVFSERFLEPYLDLAQFYPITIGFEEGIFTDQNQERDTDILISGSLGSKDYHTVEVYPVRKWLAEVLPEIGAKEGLKVKVLEHPGYFPADGIDYPKNYADVLNQAKISVGGSSCWRLPLKKFYEIPACGTILLSDFPVEDTAFFKEKILEVDPERINSQEYEDVVRGMVIDALADYDNSKKRLQPFRFEQNRFDRSYVGKALEMRAVLKTI